MCYERLPDQAQISWVGALPAKTGECATYDVTGEGSEVKGQNR